MVKPLITSYILEKVKSSLKKNLFYFLFQREEKRGRKRWRETLMWETRMGCLSHVLWPGTESAAQACALPGTEPATLHFVGQRPTNWATPAGLRNLLKKDSVHKVAFGPHLIASDSYLWKQYVYGKKLIHCSIVFYTVSLFEWELYS